MIPEESSCEDTYKAPMIWVQSVPLIPFNLSTPLWDSAESTFFLLLFLKVTRFFGRLLPPSYPPVDCLCSCFWLFQTNHHSHLCVLWAISSIFSEGYSYACVFLSHGALIARLVLDFDAVSMAVLKTSTIRLQHLFIAVCILNALSVFLVEAGQCGLHWAVNNDKTAGEILPYSILSRMVTWSMIFMVDWSITSL